MNLKSFGCSFIFGSDLSDEGKDTASLCTWPAKLAQHQGRKYECHARPGSGNLQILERVLNQSAASNSSDLFVIGWTWIDRFDYYNSNYNPQQELTPWNTIMPVDKNSVATVYYKNLHSEYRDKFTSLANIKLAIDTLKQKQIPFIMTYLDDLLFDQQWHTSPSVLELQEYIWPYMTQFENQSFLNWSRNNGYPESPGWHPLEEAHAAAAELIIKV